MPKIMETLKAKRENQKTSKGIEAINGLIDTLNGPGPFTFFVPTDSAYDAFSNEQLDNLFADNEKLAKVIKYHIVPGSYVADDLLDHLFLKTLEGLRLRVWSDISATPIGETDVAVVSSDALNYVAASTVTAAVRESIQINGANVLQANIQTDNGIIHVIDKVLIPPLTKI
jgi:uncharacterized surface protein with fasciclin (FAS1) repeats